jgi:hypothetical protein
MEWSSIAGIILAALAAIGLPLALSKRKKAGPQKREELYQHLGKIGVEATLVERGTDDEGVGVSRASGQRSEGIIRLRRQSIESVKVISVASQYGVRYFVDYFVKSPNIAAKRAMKKTHSVRVKTSGLWGKALATEWRGDESLARSLNFDYRLKDILLRADKDPGGLKGSIWIFPEPSYGYARIRTNYFLPSPEVFEGMNIIAKRVRSW